MLDDLLKWEISAVGEEVQARGLYSSVSSRASDSDDLMMTENEVGKVALHIEKEMFSLFHVTDNRYKSKYRSIMFNLKDPKNQVCASGSGLGFLPQGPVSLGWMRVM